MKKEIITSFYQWILLAVVLLTAVDSEAVTKISDVGASVTEGVFKKDYNIISDEQLQAFNNSPIDKVDQIVKGNYPILILCADEDKAALPDENTLPFEKRVNAAGGEVTVMHKPGFDHHSHSFPNPEHIVRFLLNASGSNFLANK